MAGGDEGKTSVSAVGHDDTLGEAPELAISQPKLIFKPLQT